MQQWLTNATVFDGDGWLPGHHVCLENGRIVSVSPEAPGTDDQQTDCGGGLLIPGLLDIQIYGGGGKLFAQYPEPESLAILADTNRRAGTTQCLVTIATQPVPVIMQCLDALHDYMSGGGEGILGFHLEGPFINPVKRGAHIEEWVITPTMPLIEEILQRARGHLKMITVAPECCSDEVLQRLREAGVIISAGHSNATYEQASAFSKRGVSAVTHLFNAMSPLHHREPGLPMAVIEDEKLTASIIPDGIHVDYAMMRMAKKLMGSRLLYITDAVTQTTDGPYQHLFSGTHYALPNGILSGSSLTMLQAVKNGIAHAGISPEESLRMGSLYPAQLLGLEKDYGSIKPGRKAELLLLNHDWELENAFYG